MKTFVHVLGEMLHHAPGDTMERLSPWIITFLGSLIGFLMLYAWWTGEW